MKKTTLLVLSLILAVIVIGLSGCDSITMPPGGSSRTASGIGQQATGIWVNGTGEVTITPDLALLVVGVEARGDTVAAAQEKASAVMSNKNFSVQDICFSTGDSIIYSCSLMGADGALVLTDSIPLIASAFSL
jgi:hypothetical protein